MDRLYDELLDQWNRTLGDVIELEHLTDRTRSTFARRILGEQVVELRERMARLDAQMVELREARRA